MTGNPIVVISPHLDDAVLSAAMQLARPGAGVVTVCTGEPPAGTQPAWWDRLTGAPSPVDRVRERLLEDDAALAVLGVESIARMGFPDGQHVERDEERPTQDALVAALQPQLAGVPEVWVPAGIGCHPDHVAAREAAVEAADPGAVVHYYSDVPYSLRYGWPSSVTGDPAPSPYLDVDLWLDEELRAAGLDASSMRRAVRRLDPAEQERKVTAMACYRTQIPALDYGDVLAHGEPQVVGFEVSWSRS